MRQRKRRLLCQRREALGERQRERERGSSSNSPPHYGVEEHKESLLTIHPYRKTNDTNTLQLESGQSPHSIPSTFHSSSQGNRMSTIWQQLRACNESDENLQSSTSLGSSSCTLSYRQQENNAPFMCDGTLLSASLLLQASYDSLHYLGRLLAMLLKLRSGFEGFGAFLPSFLGNINVCFRTLLSSV